MHHSLTASVLHSAQTAVTHVAAAHHREAEAEAGRGGVTRGEGKESRAQARAALGRRGPSGADESQGAGLSHGGPYHAKLGQPVVEVREDEVVVLDHSRCCDLDRRACT